LPPLYGGGFCANAADAEAAKIVAMPSVLIAFDMTGLLRVHVIDSRSKATSNDFACAILLRFALCLPRFGCRRFDDVAVARLPDARGNAKGTISSDSGARDPDELIAKVTLV
jgi:hypothetical protein